MKCAVCNSADVAPGHYCCENCEAKYSDSQPVPKPNSAKPTSKPVSAPLSDSPNDLLMLEAARVLAGQGDRKKAIAYYQEACRRLPTRADAHRELAVQLFNEAVASWLPWEKNRVAREAGLAAGQAHKLGDETGQCLFILAEVGGMVNTSPQYIPSLLHEAFTLFTRQIEQGKPVNAFYFGTALRLAQVYEVSGDYTTAINFYGIMAGASELERAGKVKPGSVTPGLVERGRADITRLQARMAQNG